MDQITDTLSIGVTFQMSLDSFLEDKHVIKSTNQEAYETALMKLEDLKRYRNPKRKCTIAKEAIHICSDCIEGYMALGLYTQDVYERMDIYKKGMELATMNLGKDFFMQQHHDLYELEEAKSLFHIKFAYACTLYEVGFMRKAQTQFQEILHLNPSDHFQVHHYLYALYLYFEELTQCKELLHKYDAQDTFHTYVKFLLFMKQGELKTAKKMIPLLKEKNRYLYDMMTYKSMNTTILQSHTHPGTAEEAGYIYRILIKIIHTLDYLHIFMTKL